MLISQTLDNSPVSDSSAGFLNHAHCPQRSSDLCSTWLVWPLSCFWGNWQGISQGKLAVWHHLLFMNVKSWERVLPKVQLACSSLNKARALNAVTGPLPTGGQGRKGLYIFVQVHMGVLCKVVLVTSQKGGDIPMDEGKLIWAALPSEKVVSSLWAFLLCCSYSKWKELASQFRSQRGIFCPGWALRHNA